MSQQIQFTNRPGEALDAAVEALHKGARVFILTDDNTSRLVLPRLRSESAVAAGATEITIPAGDVNKNLESLSHVWQALVDGRGTRTSVLVCLGGGMVTDLGGFAAATFKRGISFINMPTTLLAAVDASVGGKTGINFAGYKNEIGVFREAETVIISTLYFDTLPQGELLSGYGEMLKHGLLKSADAFARILGHDILAEGQHDSLLTLLEENVGIKSDVVRQDPTEKGIRKALNLGHTPGHAFESWAMMRRSPVPHGYAVAWGLIVDLLLSNMRLQFPSALLQQLATRVKELYGTLPVSCDDYDILVDIMRHDKKNASAEGINFTLLDRPGQVHIDCVVDEGTIREALDIFRDLTQ